MHRLYPALLLLLVVGAGLAQPPRDARPLTDQPFLGLSVRDTAEGVVVGGIQPGPLGGRGFESAAGIRRGDNVVAVNGQPISSAPEFSAAIAALKPGDAVSLTLRRSPQADPNAAVPKGGAGGEEKTYTVQLASRDEWTGTIGRGLGDRSIREPGEGEFEAMILARARELGASPGDDGVGGLEPLLAHLRNVQERALDPNSLPAVVNAFRRPLSIDETERQIAELAGEASSRPEAIVRLLSTVLDVAPLPRGSEDQLKPALDRLHAAREEWVETTDLRRPARALARHLRDSVSISGNEAGEMLLVLRRAGTSAEDLLRWHLDRLPWVMEEVERLLSPHAGSPPLADVPPHVRAAVTGDLLHVELRGGDSVFVVGGPGPNTYDMSVIGWVYDVGGDDTYESHADFCGPGVGAFAINLVDDRAGNDVYRSTEGGTQFALGAGLFGIGIILDHSGDDRYENLGPGSGWSLGAGFYGAGLLIDRAGNDAYHGEKLVQGVGGPRGFGAIIDARGDDEYKANGPNFKSVYGTPDVFVGMSQGFGYGIRGYAAGGVGAIYDLAGADRYEAGEFSQAGGYYFGLGILHDFRGNDRYVGNRYGQAFAAHQAAGILIDDEGDDSYWSMTAASQAGTWDESIGMLIDRAGNDTYVADGLAQGSAAMQALAILIDQAGDDRYDAKGNAQQGAGGPNTYHYDATKLFSFSALIDLGAGADTYSSARENNTRVRTGEFNQTAPGESSLYGIFVDE